jgi:hypothetical protein
MKKAIFAVKNKIKMKGITRVRDLVRQQVVEEVQEVIVEDGKRANSFIKLMFANRFYLYSGLAKYYDGIGVDV